MNDHRLRHHLLQRGAAVFAAASLLSGLSIVGANTAASGANSSSNATVTWAEAAQATPNFIFPFAPITYFSITNLSQFQFMMFRPLYWFGNGSQPTLNPSLSLAAQPKYSNGNKTVSFTMKSYKWSNGESVTAQDVVFWFNMLKTDKAGWAAYAPGTMPDDIASVTASGDTVTIKLTGSVNPYWFTYNELSQVTPFPMAWDIAATGQKAGSQACGTSTYAAVTVSSKGAPVSPAATSCNAVYTYLSTQSGYNPANPKASNNSLTTYATNPLWQVVDGPWHLVSFNTTGYAAFKPNSKYSGPVKPKIGEFVELPYTTNDAEYSALLGGKLTYGFLPESDVSATTSNPLKPAANAPGLAGKYALTPIYTWSINYFPYNFNSTGDGGVAGKIFQQLYFRQAFQSLVDQALYIKKVFKGYAVPTYGPVPVEPASTFVTPYEKSNPYPFSVSKAVSLLKDNGWTVKPGGISTCAVAAKCGVPVGSKLDFTMQYVGGNTSYTQIADAEQSTWSEAGIKVALTTGTFDTVIGNAIPCKGASCTWELENWGGGWLYAPDYYPTGEEIFQTGAGSNVGSYDNAQNDALIKGTDFTSASLNNWENFFAKQSPVVWQPDEAYALYEISNKLGGATPISPLLGLTPENWYMK